MAVIMPGKCHFRRSGMYSKLKFSWYAPRQPLVALRLDIIADYVSGSQNTLPFSRLFPIGLLLGKTSDSCLRITLKSLGRAISSVLGVCFANIFYAPRQLMVAVRLDIAADYIPHFQNGSPPMVVIKNIPIQRRVMNFFFFLFWLNMFHYQKFQYKKCQFRDIFSAGQTARRCNLQPFGTFGSQKFSSTLRANLWWRSA